MTLAGRVAASRKAAATRARMKLARKQISRETPPKQTSGPATPLNSADPLIVGATISAA